MENIMFKLLSGTFLALTFFSSAFGATLTCTKVESNSQNLSIICSDVSCVLNSQTEGSARSVNIPLRLIGATRATVTLLNDQTGINVILTKRSSKLSEAFYARIVSNGEIVSTCE